CAWLEPANHPASVASARRGGRGARGGTRSLPALARAGARRGRNNIAAPGRAVGGVVKARPQNGSSARLVGSFVENPSFRAIPVDKVCDKASDKGENRLSGTSSS